MYVIDRPANLPLGFSLMGLCGTLITCPSATYTYRLYFSSEDTPAPMYGLGESFYKKGSVTRRVPFGALVADKLIMCERAAAHGPGQGGVKSPCEAVLKYI